MAKNLLVINCDIRETRVALIENGIIAELHLERDSQVGTLGNIYVGKVSRVLPGMQAAFIDIGLERAAFLHVEDLIRPDDFEAYLAGHRTAMGGAAEAKTDGDGSDAPSEEDADAAGTPGARPLPASVAAVPAGGHATSAVPSGGSATPGGPAAARDEGGERRGRRRRRGRGRRSQEGGAPGPTAHADGAAGEIVGGLDRGDDEGDEESEGEEPGSLAEPAPADVTDPSLADRVEGGEEEVVTNRLPREPASAGPGEAAAADETTAVEPPTQRQVAETEPAPSRRGRGRSEAVAAPPVETAAEASPPTDEATDVAVEEEAPAPSRRRSRGRRSTRSTLDAAVAKAEADTLGAALAAPTSAGAPASLDTISADFGSDVAEAIQLDGTTDVVFSDREPLVGEVGAEGDLAEGELAEGDLAEGEAGVQLEDEGVLEPPPAGTPEDQAGTRARRSRRGKARTRRSGSPAERREKMAAVQAAPPTPSASQRERKSKAEPLRVSKSTPIREVVREGQEVIVQVSKEPIGTKGARVTSHVSLPGRYVVYLPTVEHVGISKRIGSDKERSRLRAAIDAMKPPTGGLIVRTLAEGLTKKDLKNDVGYLVRLWGEVIKKRETAHRAPECLYTELDIVLRTARDLFTDDIEKIVIDDREQYTRLKRFIEMFMPERADAIELYEGGEPIFDAYGIEEEIGRALARKVPLESGGYLIIDQAEALTAIDVNTGKFVGKGSTDLEDTILKTNLEAVQEIAYQLRFRNLGGLIVLDLIDMEKAANREKVRRRLEDLLAKDKAKTTLNRISDLGLIEMTRKRTRESLSRTMNEPCFYCDGTGNLQSKQTIAYEILRQIKRELANLRGYVVVVNAHPAVVDLLKHEERAAVQEAERRYTRRIDLVPRKEYHLEQFDLVGR